MEEQLKMVNDMIEKRAQSYAEINALLQEHKESVNAISEEVDALSKIYEKEKEEKQSLIQQVDTLEKRYVDLGSQLDQNSKELDKLIKMFKKQ